MITKSLTATVAALTLAGAVAAPIESAQAGWRGAAVAAGVLGVAAGAALATNAYARPAYAEPDYVPVYGCGYRARPVYNVYGEQVGWRRVPAC